VLAEVDGMAANESALGSRKILGEATAVKQMIKLIERVAQTKTNVLVIGESGTGKELVARMIHDAGPLKGKPFIPVNCGAIPENLIESEMFGHRKGSFTGAVSEKAGLFEASNGGTLFLDEVGELPLTMQVKLLRAIQERVFRKVGGTDDIRVDVRIIAATNRDLEAGVKKGTFREDLYYRLNVILIKTPSLKERKEDILLLAQSFLEKFSQRQNKGTMRFSSEVEQALQMYSWPGNVRELENIVERAVTLESESQVELHSLPQMIVGNYLLEREKLTGVKVGGGVASASLSTGAGSDSSRASPSVPSSGSAGEIRLPAPQFENGPMDLEAILADVEKRYLTAALEHAQGVKKHAADLLRVTFRSMRYRLKKHGLSGTDSDSDGDAGDQE